MPKRESESTASAFYSAVVKIIKKVPYGKVATYGQIAALAGKPHGARGVAWILHSSSKAHNLPWHRIVNAKGLISFPAATMNYQRQRQRLAKEGVEFLEFDRIDLRQFQWRKIKNVSKDSL